MMPWRVAAALAFWIALSATLIIFNAALLQDFRHPIWLTFWHQCVSTLLILAVRLAQPNLVATGDEKAGTPPLTASQAIRIGLPVAAAQCIGLMAGNIAVMNISVSFCQMIKAWTPACVYTIGCFVGNSQWSPSVAKSLLGITFGLMITSLGELRFDMYGFSMQLVALLSEGVRINLLELRLKSQGYKLNPLSSIMVFAPMAAGILMICGLVFDADGLSMEAIDRVGELALFLNALIAFGLNLAIYLAIQVASGLVFTLAGVVKDIMIISGSVFVFGTIISPLQLLGYTIALSALQVYGQVSKATDSFDNTGIVLGMWKLAQDIWISPPPQNKPQEAGEVVGLVEVAVENGDDGKA